jgi:hypothetical protein
MARLNSIEDSIQHCRLLSFLLFSPTVRVIARSVLSCQSLQAIASPDCAEVATVDGIQQCRALASLQFPISLRTLRQQYLLLSCALGFAVAQRTPAYRRFARQMLVLVRTVVSGAGSTSDD